ncbi:MAG: DUF3352 domain-containing protein [Candidatus Xenobia bacterium]
MASACQQCGTGLEEGERFCNRCGTPVVLSPVAVPVSMPAPPPPRRAVNPMVRNVLSFAAGAIATSVLCLLIWMAGHRPVAMPPAKLTATPTPVTRSGIPATAPAWLAVDFSGLAPAMGGDGRDAIAPWRHTHLWQALQDALKARSIDLEADVVPWLGNRVSLCIVPAHERWPVVELSVRDMAKAHAFVRQRLATWKADLVSATELYTSPDGPVLALVDDQMLLADSAETLQPALDTWAGHQPSVFGQPPPAVDMSAPLAFGADPAFLTRFLPASILQQVVPAALPKVANDLFESVKLVGGSVTAGRDGSAKLDLVLVPQDADKHPMMGCLLQAAPVTPGDAARILPSDAALYGVFDINNVRKMLETGAAYDDTTLKQLGDAVRDLKDKQIDLEKDLLGSLTGEVAWTSGLRPQGDEGAERAVTDCATHLREMSNACEVYKIDHSTYPDSLLDLHPKYLAELPTCPAGGSYHYQRSSDGDSFTLYCAGEAHAAAGCSTDKPSFDSTAGLDWGRPDGALRAFYSEPTLIAVGVKDRPKLAATVRALLAGVPREDSQHNGVKEVKFDGRVLMAFADQDRYLLIGLGPVRAWLEAAIDAPAPPSASPASGSPSPIASPASASRFTVPARGMVSALYVDPTQLVKALGDSLPEQAVIDFLAPFRQVWLTTGAEAGTLHLRISLSK